MVSQELAKQQIEPKSNFKLENSALGFQLVATHIIPKNELILAGYYSLADFQTMHTFQIDDSKHVICPIVERINHCCDPNCGLIVDTNNGVLKVELLRGKISTLDRSSIFKMHQESLHRYQRHDFKQKLDIMLSSPQSYTVAVVRSLKDNRIYAFLRGANLCFSESRAASGGINGGSHRLDMRFCGTLAQYIVIAGPRDIAMNTERKYEDFNVWSITPQLMGRESSYGLT